MNELKNCSRIKGILMLLIVLYHSLRVYGPTSWGPYAPAQAAPVLGVLAGWLNSFHIYAFALISGYLFYYVKYQRGGYERYLPFLKKKAKRLLVPYAFVAAVWVMPVYAWFFGTDALVDKFILGCSPSQLWFLLMLFWAFAIFWPVSDVADDHPVLGGVIVCLLYCVGKLAPELWCLDQGLGYLPYFYLGFLIRKLGLGKRLLYRLPWYGYLAADLVLFVLAEQLRPRAGVLYKLAAIGVKELLHMVGAAGAFVILQRLTENYFRESRMLDFFARHSMAVYLLHQQIIYFVIGGLNGMVPPLVVALCSFGISLAVSVGISVWMSKTRFTRFLLGG